MIREILIKIRYQSFIYQNYPYSLCHMFGANSKILSLLSICIIFAALFQTGASVLRRFETASQQFLEDLDKVKIFDCFEYTGQDSLLEIKLNTMQFVDYFVIMEVERTGNESERGLWFNRMDFKQYANKLIYLPIRNFPHNRNTKSFIKKRENLRYIKNSANQILKLMAHDQDIVIFSREGEIIKEEVLKYFQTKGLSYSCTELSLHFNYLNRILVHGQGISEPIRHTWPEGAKIVQVKIFRNYYKNNTCSLGSEECGQDSILKKAGWFFDMKTQKQQTDKIIQKYPGSYLKDLTLEQLQLPQKILKDIIQNQQQSKYSSLLTFFNNSSEKVAKKIKKYVPQVYDGKRLVIECNPFNGQNHILSLKGKIGMNFVSYYIVTEGHFTHRGRQKALTFNFSNFQEIAHKIIYVPLVNMPWQQLVQQERQRWQNQNFMRNSAAEILKVMALGEDILLISDVDQMISREGLLKFDPQKEDIASTEVRIFLFYFNRQTFLQNSGRSIYPRYQYNTVKVMKWWYLNKVLQNNLTTSRTYGGCHHDTKSSSECQGRVLQLVGWHFTYVLDDENIQRKFNHAADSTSDRKIIDFEAERALPLFFNSFTRDVDIFNGTLPVELVEDLRTHGKKSIFAKYVSQMFWKSLTGVQL